MFRLKTPKRCNRNIADTGNSLDGTVGRIPADGHPTNRAESVLSKVSEENKTVFEEKRFREIDFERDRRSTNDQRGGRT